MPDISGLLILFVGLAGLIALFVLPAWIVHRIAAERMEYLEGQLQSWKGRISSLEASVRMLQESTTETRDAVQAAARDARVARPHVLGRDVGPDEITFPPISSHPQSLHPRASGAAESGLLAGDQATGPGGAKSGPPSPPTRQVTLHDLAREAAASLVSVGAFTEFAARYSNGAGYVLDPSGQSVAPSQVQGAPDRADLWALSAAGQAVVFPGFNLRRSVPLLTGDNGRPAEARLGWLFDLVRGDELQALEPAVVSLENWSVQRKGRLVLPL